MMVLFFLSTMVNNWNPINTGLTSATISTIFAYNNKLVAATFNGNGSDIYLSTNNGSNWAKFNTGLTSDIYVYDFISLETISILQPVKVFGDGQSAS